jgi:hypothetical protein
MPRNKPIHMRNLNLALLLIVFYCLFCPVSQAQNNNAQSGIDRKKWEKISEQYDYSKEKAEEQKILKTDTSQGPSMPMTLHPVLFEIIKYTLFGIVILILIYIGYRLIRNGKFWDNKKVDKPKIYTLDNLEENLKEADIDSFLDDALRNKDYRLAVRLMYLNIIKSLANKELINWKIDKTNGEYLYEMYKNSLYKDFRKCTLAYEFIWFNEPQDFEKSDYEMISPSFLKLLTAINSPKKTV